MRFQIHRIGATTFALWGLLHAALGSIFLAMWLWGPPDAFASSGIPADTSAHARALMMQNNVSLIAGGLTVLVLAIRVGWRGTPWAFKAMMGISTLFMFETTAFELIPGHLSLAQVGASIVLWIVANALGGATLMKKGSPHDSPSTA